MATRPKSQKPAEPKPRDPVVRLVHPKLKDRVIEVHPDSVEAHAKSGWYPEGGSAPVPESADTSTE
jgi:hypothetical protein